MSLPGGHIGQSVDDALAEFCEIPGQQEMFEDTVDRQRALRGLRSARKALGRTQTEVAESMGIGQSSVSELEGERDDVHVSTLQRYARAVGKRLEMVFLSHNEHVEIVFNETALVAETAGGRFVRIEFDQASTHHPTSVPYSLMTGSDHWTRNVPLVDPPLTLVNE